MENHGLYDPIINTISPCMSEAHNATLVAPFSQEEYHVALYQMHLGKAPSLGGLNHTF